MKARVEVRSADALKKLANDLRRHADNSMVVLGAVVGDKPQMVVAVGDALVQSKGLNAGNIVREAAKKMQGGGGGQPFLATAGGSHAAGLNDAMEAVLSYL